MQFYINIQKRCGKVGEIEIEVMLGLHALIDVFYDHILHMYRIFNNKLAYLIIFTTFYFGFLFWGDFFGASFLRFHATIVIFTWCHKRNYIYNNISTRSKTTRVLAWKTINNSIIGCTLNWQISRLTFGVRGLEIAELNFWCLLLRTFGKRRQV